MKAIKMPLQYNLFHSCTSHRTPAGAARKVHLKWSCFSCFKKIEKMNIFPSNWKSTYFEYPNIWRRKYNYPIPQPLPGPYKIRRTYTTYSSTEALSVPIPLYLYNFLWRQKKAWEMLLWSIGPVNAKGHHYPRGTSQSYLFFNSHIRVLQRKNITLGVNLRFGWEYLTNLTLRNVLFIWSYSEWIFFIVEWICWEVGV